MDPTSSPHEFFSDFQPPKLLALTAVDVLELKPENVILPDNLIEGLLYRGTKMVIAGGSKSYKTWLLIHLAYCLACGSNWLGFSTLRCRVCYANLELKTPIFSQRLLTVGQALHPELQQRRFFVLHFRDATVEPESLYLSLLDSIKNNGYDVIIIDPVYKLLGDRDENSAKDMTKLMFDLEKIAATNNVAVIFGHHYPKGSAAAKDPLDRLAGSGVFGRDLDSVITLTPHETPDCYTADFILRNHRPLDPFVVRWHYPLFALDTELDPEALKKMPGGRPPACEPNDILDLLRNYDDQLTPSQFESIAQDHLGISRRTLYRKLKTLRAQNLIFDSKLTGFLNIRANSNP
jgi:AAA domain-containing protein